MQAKFEKLLEQQAEAARQAKEAEDEDKEKDKQWELLDEF